jgi:hypothetical protein
VPVGTLLDRRDRAKIAQGADQTAHREVAEMPRARWLLVAFLLVAAVVGGILNERGPFGAHPGLVYDQFLADFQAGNVDRIVQWRDRLEVTEHGALFTVVMPVERDFPADLAQARRAGGVGISFGGVPDAWLGVMTPSVPIVIAVAAVLVWAPAVLRDWRRGSGSSAAGSPQPAG